MDTKAGFRDLIAWQKAHELTSAVFRATQELPAEASWLTNQILRCCISVPANIAEGHGRGTRAELLRFLDIARGSLSELEYYLHFLDTEGLLAKDRLLDLQNKREETARILFGLWRSLKSMSQTEWDHSGRVREEAGIYRVI
jgi:four helix bundle protein